MYFNHSYQKKYFFFSHTIKHQPYNRKLLQAILQKKIELYDYEAIVNEKGHRLIGFGRYAGLVGAYNGFRVLGKRDALFNLPRVETLHDFSEMKDELDNFLNLYYNNETLDGIIADDHKNPDWVEYARRIRNKILEHRQLQLNKVRAHRQGQRSNKNSHVLRQKARLYM